MSVGGPQLAHGRRGRAVEVLDLVGRVLGLLAGEAHADQRLGLAPAAKLHELLQAGVARFQAAPAGGEGHAPGRVADGGRPVEALGRAAAEADDARPQGLEGFGHVGAPAEDGAGGHERNLVDPQRARPAERNASTWPGGRCRWASESPRSAASARWAGTRPRRRSCPGPTAPRKPDGSACCVRRYSEHRRASPAWTNLPPCEIPSVHGSPRFCRMRCETLPLKGLAASSANSPRCTAPSGYQGCSMRSVSLRKSDAIGGHALEAAVEHLLGEHRGRQAAEVLDELAVLKGADAAATDTLAGDRQGCPPGDRLLTAAGRPCRCRPVGRERLRDRQCYDENQSGAAGFPSHWCLVTGHFQPNPSPAQRRRVTWARPRYCGSGPGCRGPGSAACPWALRPRWPRGSRSCRGS